MATEVQCSLNCKHLKKEPDEEYGFCTKEAITLKLWILMNAGKGSLRGQECLHFGALGND